MTLRQLGIEVPGGRFAVLRMIAGRSPHEPVETLYSDEIARPYVVGLQG